MAAHLAHKIPWESLCSMFVMTRDGTGWMHDPPQAQKNQLKHIGRVIAHTLGEFQSTCKTTEAELAVLNAKDWDIEEYSNGAYTGYYDSLLWGYIELNMLLTDPDRIAPLLRNDRGECSHVMSLLLGRHDGHHPEAIAEKLAPAFDYETLRPLTAEVLQTLRDHAALLFRCMYIMPGENRLLDEDHVIYKLFTYFSWYLPCD